MEKRLLLGNTIFFNDACLFVLFYYLNVDLKTIVKNEMPFRAMIEREGFKGTVL